MSSNSRFALDERRYVIDGINVANSGKAYCPEGDPEDDKHLREYVLQVCLRAASSVALERVQADIDIGTIRILVSEPRLKFRTADYVARCSCAEWFRRSPGCERRQRACPKAGSFR